MNDRDTGEYEGLSPAEATDPDQRADEEIAEVPEDWSAADRWGTTPREEYEGEPLNLRLTEELPEDAPPEPERPCPDTLLDELHEVDDYGQRR